MGVAFSRGQVLTMQDLFFKCRNSSNALIDPYRITYSIYDNTGGMSLLVAPADREPVRAAIGQYWANFTIDPATNIGDHLIVWEAQEMSTSPVQRVEERFSVVGMNLETTMDAKFNSTEKKLMKRLRVLLRDNNPDRNYHFRPPTDRDVIRSYTERFGFIWEDDELYEYLLSGVDSVALTPPVISFELNTIPKHWDTLVIRAAMVHALRALTYNWIEEEFSYSIQGISLDIDKASKYAAQADTLAVEVKEAIEQAKLTVKTTKGLQQSRFRVGAQGALGPYTGRNSTNPRTFIGGDLGQPS